jgi:hypothetical protein
VLFLFVVVLTCLTGNIWSHTHRHIRLENAAAIIFKLVEYLRGPHPRSVHLVRFTNRTSSAFTPPVRHNGLGMNWVPKEDTVIPFGDPRGSESNVYTFDLDQGILFFCDKDESLQISLSRLREPDSGFPGKSEFTPFEIPSPSQIDLSAFPPPYQRPTTIFPDGQVAFTSRVLSDFAGQWRHILRRTYNDSTFLKLAKAIISIVTCDFNVSEISVRWQHFPPPPAHVPVLNLPPWKPCESRLLNIGGTNVVLDQELRTALRTAKDDAIGALETKDQNGVEPKTYLLLSIRYLMLCRVDCTGSFSYTAPTKFLDGQDPPSAKAMELLLQALSPPSRIPRTPILALPLEIQDQILQYVSESTVEAARLGCLLGLGSPGTWMRARDPSRRGGPIQLLKCPTHRLARTPIDSKILFGKTFSGVLYR